MSMKLQTQYDQHKVSTGQHIDSAGENMKKISELTIKIRNLEQKYKDRVEENR